MSYFFLLLFGVVVGILSGLLGIGGGIVLVPGLMLLFGLSQPEAQGTSLAVLVPPIGVFAAVVYYQHGYVRLPVVGWIAVGFLLGALIGAKLVPMIPLTVLRIAFGVILLYEGFTFVMSPLATRTAAALPAGVATIGATMAASLIRRKRERTSSRPEKPGDDLEYHI